MGACSSSPPQGADRRGGNVNNKNQQKGAPGESASDQRTHKLLLLGAGSSGKSTLFKQLMVLYDKGKEVFSDEARQMARSTVHQNIITSIKELCDRSRDFEPVTAANQGSKNAIDALVGDEEIDPEFLGPHIAALWADQGIQTTFQRRNKFQLYDTAPYFLDRIKEISSKDYLPSIDDVMRIQVRTTGIVEMTFEIEGNQFKLFDVGGQRNERKKWSHCFENVTAVLFVAALSGYDQLLHEDEQTNRLSEAVGLFGEICNSTFFRQTSMILFLNKRDLFEQKLDSSPLNQFFPEYHGASVNSATEFISRLFRDKNHQQDKKVYTHIICATDRDSVQREFTSVKDIIIRKGVENANLA